MTGYSLDPVEILTDAECWRLLARPGVARLAVSVAGEPDIFPITAVAHDGRLVFRTVEGTKLISLVLNARVAVERDGLTDDHAWSVVVRGRAQQLEDGARIEAAARLPLYPQVETVKSVYVEITPTVVSGRRFRLAAGS